MQGRTNNIHIGGGSYGGLLSCYGLFTQRYFKDGICMSSSFWWDNQNFVHSVLPRLPKLSLRVYIDSGEDNREETLEVRGALVEEGYTPGRELFYYYDPGGEHEVSVLGKSFRVPLLSLFGSAGDE